VRDLVTDGDSGMGGLYSEPKEFAEQKVLYRSDILPRCRWWTAATRWSSPAKCWSSTGASPEVAGYELETAGVLKASATPYPYLVHGPAAGA
jgi:hypothetical protein